MKMERESRYLEYKENHNSKSFLKAVSAFANYEGGKIIFGVADDLKIVGIKTNLAQTCLDIENTINDSIQPAPEYELEIDNRRKLIILRVYAGLNKPYLFKGKAYKRNDSATVEVDRLEYGRLVLEGNNLTFDEITAKKQDLSFVVLEDKLKEKIQIQELSQDVLRTLNLFNPQKGFSNAGAILADKNDFAGIDVVRFGDSLNEILERQEFKNISAILLLEETITVFERNYCLERITDFQRQKVELIPKIAFREAVANALVHRTWDTNSNINVRMFKDRIEINSLGGLPSGLTEAEYLAGKISVLRNPILADIFHRLDYIERLGTGITKIKESYKTSLSKPEFILSANIISVILPCINNIELSKEEEKLYHCLDRSRFISRIEIENITQFNKNKSIALLNSLMGKGLIIKQGKSRGVKYKKK